MSRLPPDILQAVAYVKVKTVIDAPVETVWNAILDFPAYTKWNPFVCYQVITNTSFKPLSAHPRPTEGAHILMHTQMPPRLDDDEQGLQSAKDIITYMDEAKPQSGLGSSHVSRVVAKGGALAGSYRRSNRRTNGGEIHDYPSSVACAQ